MPLRLFNWLTLQRPHYEAPNLPVPPPHEENYHALANRVQEVRLRLQLKEERERRARDWGDE